MQDRFFGLPEREPWAGVDWDTDPDWEFRTAVDLDPEPLHKRYQDACVRSRTAVANASSLNPLSVQPLRSGQLFSLRWVLLHLLATPVVYVSPLPDGVAGQVWPDDVVATVSLWSPAPRL